MQAITQRGPRLQGSRTVHGRKVAVSFHPLAAAMAHTRRMDQRSLIAAIRFGLGPRPDQPLPGDVPAWLKAQIRSPETDLALPEGWERPPTVADGLDLRRQDELAPVEAGKPSRQVVLNGAEAQALIRNAVTTQTPFRERLVLFWANHLTVSTREGAVRALVGDFVRSAIRPHVGGRFEDMLVASTHHPAMLFYLNQNASVGPGSRIGLRQGRGLNENLAREVMELHSLSPAAGYSQEDVTEFARLLTGLTVERLREPLGSRFQPDAHEPGPRTILGQRFEEGPGQVDTALRWLANHEATHRHLAVKLARHFVADDPGPGTVEYLFGVLRDTRGDLGAVAEALVDLPEAWQAPLSKLRSPQDFMIASYRLLNGGADAAQVVAGGMRSLGQDIWSAPAPIGWPDTAEGWVSAEGMIQRMEVAYNVAGRHSRLDPNNLLDAALGPLARPETVQAVRRAGSTRDGLTLLLASPEFQRR